MTDSETIDLDYSKLEEQLKALPDNVFAVGILNDQTYSTAPDAASNKQAMLLGQCMGGGWFSIEGQTGLSFQDAVEMSQRVCGNAKELQGRLAGEFPAVARLVTDSAGRWENGRYQGEIGKALAQCTNGEIVRPAIVPAYSFRLEYRNHGLSEPLSAGMGEDYLPHFMNSMVGIANEKCQQRAR